MSSETNSGVIGNDIGPLSSSSNYHGSSNLAINVSGLYKSYGSRRSKVSVLRDLDMKVKTGAIYGLLGPSGCGKTTLLKCILGCLQVNGGEVLTLGKPPGSFGHEVPGRRVGYMPQELALFMNFTIGETLSYFGRLHRMKKDNIKKRTEFLLQLLNLPSASRLISQLSGGQQRRTSFAIALLQEPELLILDEPTVGVDPLLRQRIWQHLLTIAKTHTTTIIITTHYVEEARQAHMVGLMRGGRLLAESAPDDLLTTYRLTSLEDVFLRLCEQDQGSDEEEDEPKCVIRHKRLAVGPTTSEEREPLFEEEISVRPKSTYQDEEVSRCARCCSWWPSGNNILAQAIKNFIVLRRNIGFLLFEFFLPALQITLFCLCIGREPYNLTMHVVNNETCDSLNSTKFCGSTDFLHHLNNRTIHQVNSSYNLEGALEAVRQGDSWGVINIAENFTADLIERISPFKPSTSNSTIEGSTIHLHLDMTNEQISITLNQKIMEAFNAFLQDFIHAEDPSLDPSRTQLPIKLEEPVYGDLNPSFTNFMAPGIILSIIFFMATGLTALAFVMERKQGLMDRSMVAGVTTIEIMFGHICTQFVVMTVQVGLLLLFALAVFGVQHEGPIILVIVLALFQGITGMTMGLLVSALCEEETSAIQCSLGLVYPNMLLSGIIWPLQSMPTWLRYISYCLPMTFSAQAMRSVLARGWDLTYMLVWRGYLMTFGWGLLMIILSVIVLKIKGK